MEEGPLIKCCILCTNESFRVLISVLVLLQVGDTILKTRSLPTGSDTPLGSQEPGLGKKTVTCVHLDKGVKETFW